MNFIFYLFISFFHTVENVVICILWFQVLQFVVAHIDVFNVIIREKLNTMNLPSLRELSLLTAVLGRAAYHGM